MPDFSNLVTCDMCGYAYERPNSNMRCSNPACFANPEMTEATKSRVLAEHAKRTAAEADRKQVHQTRVRTMDAAAMRHRKAIQL